MKLYHIIISDGDDISVQTYESVASRAGGVLALVPAEVREKLAALPPGGDKWREVFGNWAIENPNATIDLRESTVVPDEKRTVFYRVPGWRTESSRDEMQWFRTHTPDWKTELHRYLRWEFHFEDNDDLEDFDVQAVMEGHPNG